MPKINVYLPDDLADAVRDTGVPVSAICQRALEQAVRRITAIRRTVLGTLDDDDLGTLLPSFTGRARAVLALARDADGPSVTTGDLLNGIVIEGSNLAVQVLRSMDIDPRRVTVTGATEPGGGEPGGGDGAGRRFSTAAATALELAAAEATGLGHNYVGCEHLVIALAAEPDGAAGRALRAAGADAKALRRAVSAALAGYTHLRAQTAPAQTPAWAAAVRQELAPLVRRIEALEARLG
jgi:ATP-dependent Clp protease ATP-binding subunit ClpC